MTGLFIGDVHGRISSLRELLRKYGNKDTKIIQLGDLGAGFKNIDIRNFATEFPNFRFIRGNHDSPEVCRAHPSYLGDYGFLEKYNIFFVSGAASIDKEFRLPFVSWWPDEELSYDELEAAIRLYEKVKPRVILSHTAPSEINGKILHSLHQIDESRTSKALQMMFSIHEPNIWLFGHHHKSWKSKVGRTTFICLNELETVEMTLP